MKKILFIVLGVILIAISLIVIQFYNSPEYKARKEFLNLYGPTIERQKKIMNNEIESLIDNKNIVDTEKKKEALRQYGKIIAMQVKILDGKTFKSNMEGFVTNTFGHSKSVRGQNDGYGYMNLDTQGIKEVVVSTNVKIPLEADSMRFSYKFLIPDKGGLLEAFIKDIPVFNYYTENDNTNTIGTYLENKNQNDWTDSGWISLGAFAGQEVALSFRLTNFNEISENKYNVVAIDDIYFASIK